MENTPYLYNTLVQVLGQHANWVDLRHLKTLAWMMVGPHTLGLDKPDRLGTVRGESSPL